MRARLSISIFAVILYVALFNTYVWNILTWGVYLGKLFYNGLTLWAILFAFLDLKLGFVNDYHKQFNTLLFCCVFMNYGLIILKLLEVINPMTPQPMFYTFNGGVFFITVTIFFNEIRYKIFTDD